MVSRYIEFKAADGSTVLMEVSPDEIAAGGVQRAGLRDALQKSVAQANETFEQALQGAVRYNAEVLIQAIGSLSMRPAEAVITFGLVATGELGNIAVAKLGGQANYQITLTWRPTDDSKS